MLDKITVIQCFVSVRGLGHYGTDREVKCNRFTKSAYQIYISYLISLL